jgi:hypothetical protein
MRSESGTPTDRGYAFIGANDDGTSNIYVAIGVTASGRPEDVIAVHYRRSNITLDPHLTMVPAGSMRRTTEIAHVNADADGIVHIRRRHAGLGPLFTSNGSGAAMSELRS